MYLSYVFPVWICFFSNKFTYTVVASVRRGVKIVAFSVHLTERKCGRKGRCCSPHRRYATASNNNMIKVNVNFNVFDRMFVELSMNYRYHKCGCQEGPAHNTVWMFENGTLWSRNKYWGSYILSRSAKIFRLIMEIHI